MEYFLVQQDRRYGHAPHLKDVFNTIDKRDLSRERCNRVPGEITFAVDSDPEMNYLDLLEGQLFMVSAKLRHLLSKYEPALVFKTISLIDYGNGRNEIYYLPILEEVDCIASQSEFNRDKSVLLKIVLNEKAIHDKPIFRLGGVATPYVVARLDLVESILRRDFEGISFTRLAVQNDYGVKRL